MKNNKSKRKQNFNTGFYCNDSNSKIIVTEHAIERYKLRHQKEHITDQQAISAIIHQVKRSRLISITKDGEELRSHFGYMYVCKREKGLLEDTLVVITLKLSKVMQKKNFSSTFSLDSVDYEKMCPAI